jgi:hypothetical protein
MSIYRPKSTGTNHAISSTLIRCTELTVRRSYEDLVLCPTARVAGCGQRIGQVESEALIGVRNR